MAAISVSLVIMGLGLTGQTREESKDQPAFLFREIGYFHRWSGKDQDEFTPAHQEDLKAWSEMVTVNGYRDVPEGEALAAKANAVLENYKSHRAMVVKTSSVPATADKPAEHFIAVLFPQPSFIEAAFARFRIANGYGYSCVYSHRIYGEKVGDQMSTWLKANGKAAEKALMDWNSMPTSLSVTRRTPTSGAELASR